METGDLVDAYAYDVFAPGGNPCPRMRTELSIYHLRQLYSRRGIKQMMLVMSLIFVFYQLLPAASDEPEGHNRPRSGRPGSIVLYAKLYTGSTLAAALLGQHPDIYYLSEPLEYLADDQDSILDAAVLDYLRQLLQCHFWGLVDQGIRRHQAKYKHSRSQGIRSFTDSQANIFCMSEHALQSQGMTRRQCAQAPPGQHERMCRQMPIVAVRVTRVHQLSRLKSLMTQDGVKVIQLVRDPRGIIDSRLDNLMATSGHTIDQVLEEESARLIMEAKAYCWDIYSDLAFLSHHRLELRESGDYHLVRYEDVLKHPRDVALDIYSFIGITVVEHPIQSMKTQINSSISEEHVSNPILYEPWDTSPRWRHRLPWRLVQSVQVACMPVMNVLGYTMFENVKDMRDSYKPAVKFPAEESYMHLIGEEEPV